MLKKNKQYFEHRRWAGNEARKEIDDGLKLLDSVDRPIVSFFGSHLVKPDEKIYKHAQRAAAVLGERGYAIVTGGGPGIMYAANSGAFKSGAPSIGIRASLIRNEGVKGDVYTHRRAYTFLFVRRFILSIKSEALIFYPGGFGTLNELFEYVVLIETGMSDNIPIIMVGKSYWKGLFTWIKKRLAEQGFLTHGNKELKLFHFVDTVDEIVDIIEKNK